MNTLPSKKLISKALKVSKFWDFGNNVLYDLCKKNFYHRDTDKIIAKFWIIGRSYAAAVERNKKERSSEGNFYINELSSIVKKSGIDIYLNKLRNIRKIDQDSIPLILECHWYLTYTLNEITGHNNRSLCSKYLHFHLPELFFLFDSRAVVGLRTFISYVPKPINNILENIHIDSDYAKLYCKCYQLKRNIENNYKIKLTNRQLDSILIFEADAKLKT